MLIVIVIVKNVDIHIDIFSIFFNIFYYLYFEHYFHIVIIIILFYYCTWVNLYECYYQYYYSSYYYHHCCCCLSKDMIWGRINLYIIQAALFTSTFQVWFYREAVLGKYCLFFVYTFFLLLFVSFLNILCASPVTIYLIQRHILMHIFDR